MVLIKRHFYHITLVLQSLHWQTLALRIDFKILVLVFQLLHGSGLKYITDMLLPNEQSRIPRTSGTSLLVVLRVKTKHGKSFCYHGTKAWNNLPVHIRHFSLKCF